MRFRLVSCFLAVCMTPPVAAAAQPSASPSKSDAMTDQARELFVKGAALYEQRQYERAEAAFLAAWVLKKHFQIAGNLGRCEMKLGKFRNAAVHLALFLKELPSSGNQDERKRTQALFDEARAKVAVVEIQVDVAGAEVRVDGQTVGAAPLAAEVYVEPGKRTIEATRDGYQDAREVVDAKAGGLVTVSLKLEQSFLSRPNPLATVPPIVEPAPRSMAPAVILGGVALAAGGVGVGFLVAAGNKAADADALLSSVRTREQTEVVCPKAMECAEISASRSGHDTDVGIGRGLLIVGGVALAAGVTYVLWPSRGVVRSEARVSLVPVVSTAGSGMWLRGAF
jgi:hypothetical protein